MVECFTTRLCCFNEDLQIGASRRLTNKIGKGLRPQRGIEILATFVR
jgi:hypothetical protein